MRKTYIAPRVETVDAHTGEIMAGGIVIPVSGGTTPEESDAKPGFTDDEEDDSLWED